MKPYYCHTEDTDISYLEITNNLSKKPVDKLANEEIPTLLDYLESKRPRQQKRSRKSQFTKNPINETVDIFINHKERVNYKFTLKLRHDGIITTPGDPLKRSYLTKIESLLVNGVLQCLQYDFNKLVNVNLFKSYLICEIKGKTIEKLYKNSRLVVQGYNNIEKMALLIQAPTI